VLESGCRPVRALAVLAELVGRSGKVVGIDFSVAAVQRARSVVATLGLDNVQVFAGDVHTVNRVDPYPCDSPNRQSAGCRRDC
jgi:precorrin-6B methylase 2